MVKPPPYPPVVNQRAGDHTRQVLSGSKSLGGETENFPLRESTGQKEADASGISNDDRADVGGRQRRVRTWARTRSLPASPTVHNRSYASGMRLLVKFCRARSPELSPMNSLEQLRLVSEISNIVQRCNTSYRFG